MCVPSLIGATALLTVSSTFQLPSLSSSGNCNLRHPKPCQPLHSPAFLAPPHLLRHPTGPFCLPSVTPSPPHLVTHLHACRAICWVPLLQSAVWLTRSFHCLPVLSTHTSSFIVSRLCFLQDQLCRPAGTLKQIPAASQGLVQGQHLTGAQKTFIGKAKQNKTE